MQYVGFHRKMDQFVFDRFIVKNQPLEEILKELPKYKNKYKNDINFYFFNNDYCRKYVSAMYEKMASQSYRRFGYTKEVDFLTMIIKRFVRNKKNWAFLPQGNIAKVLEVSQKSVSRYIEKLVKGGFLVVRKRYHSKYKKATEYSLSEKGLQLYNKFVKTVNKIVSTAKNLINNNPISNFIEQRKREVFQENYLRILTLKKLGGKLTEDEETILERYKE